MERQGEVLQQNLDPLAHPQDTLAEIVRESVRTAGLDACGAEECVAAYCKRHRLRCSQDDGMKAAPGRQEVRDARWFAIRWVYDRTVVIKGWPLDTGPPVLRNVDLDTIAAIVKTFTPSSWWLWRRVEIDGAPLKHLAAETGISAYQLHRDLEKIKRAIRRELDGEQPGKREE